MNYNICAIDCSSDTEVLYASFCDADGEPIESYEILAIIKLCHTKTFNSYIF